MGLFFFFRPDLDSTGCALIGMATGIVSHRMQLGCVFPPEARRGRSPGSYRGRRPNVGGALRQTMTQYPRLLSRRTRPPTRSVLLVKRRALEYVYLGRVRALPVVLTMCCCTSLPLMVDLGIVDFCGVPHPTPSVNPGLAHQVSIHSKLSATSTS